MSADGFGSGVAPSIEVTNNEIDHRYEVRVDGEFAGFAAYRPRGDRVVFTHTEVDPRWEGHGIGSALARGALDDVVAHHQQITPLCPFIADYIARHPGYLQHVDAAHRAAVSGVDDR
ncbi:MAG TPA: GNAT family N-acetyltransferase [Mycobacteriales bacterium]|nr:GNAT family N-acetyltransferase [Mycobacteriales bacterium]